MSQIQTEGGTSPFRKPQPRPQPIAPESSSGAAEADTRHSLPRFGRLQNPAPMTRSRRHMSGRRELLPWAIGGAGLVVLVAAIMSYGRPSAGERRACELYANAETEDLRRTHLAPAQPLDKTEATASELGLSADKVNAIAVSGWCARSREQATAAWWQANKADVEAKRANDAADAVQREKRARAASQSTAAAKGRPDVEQATSLEQSQRRLDEIHRDSARAVAESQTRFDQLKRFYGQ